MNIKKLYNKSFTTNPDMKLQSLIAVLYAIELVNKDKIRMLKRICHKMKCYKEMSGDCRQCQMHKELKQIKGGR